MVDVVDVRRDTPAPVPARAAVPSAWAPLRHTWFRALWIAQFVANTGTWAQTVGAQWLMGDLGGSALQIALVQTAATLPVFLLVVPAGALGDIVDRRRLLLLSQTSMLLSAAALAVLTAAGAVTPNRLLALTALLATGQALAAPCFQAVQPELVPREELPQAALLNGANANVARAVGPAVGGLLIAAAGPAAAFALNAVSFLGVLAVLYRWPRPATERPLGAEPIRQAIRAGMRYVRSAPLFSSVLARSGLFMVFASGLWALLPALARGPLGLGANGYGGLLAAVGFGAVAGTVVLPRLRARRGADGVVTGATLVYAAAVAVVGLNPSAFAVVGALVLAGLSWIAVQSTLGATAQLVLPTWARARAGLLPVGLHGWAGTRRTGLGRGGGRLRPPGGLPPAGRRAGRRRAAGPAAPAALGPRRPAHRAALAEAAALPGMGPGRRPGPGHARVAGAVRRGDRVPGRDAGARPRPSPHRCLPVGSVPGRGGPAAVHGDLHRQHVERAPPPAPRTGHGRRRGAGDAGPQPSRRPSRG